MFGEGKFRFTAFLLNKAVALASPYVKFLQDFSLYVKELCSWLIQHKCYWPHCIVNVQKISGFIWCTVVIIHSSLVFVKNLNSALKREKKATDHDQYKKSITCSFNLMCATSSIYLISVAVKAFLVVDNFCVVKGKMVLYLTVHFQFRAGDFFVFLGYPPIAVAAVYQHPNIMRTIHLLTVSLQNTTQSLQVFSSKDLCSHSSVGTSMKKRLIHPN